MNRDVARVRGDETVHQMFCWGAMLSKEHGLWVWASFGLACIPLGRASHTGERGTFIVADSEVKLLKAPLKIEFKDRPTGILIYFKYFDGSIFLTYTSRTTSSRS